MKNFMDWLVASSEIKAPNFLLVIFGIVVVAALLTVAF